MSKPVMRKLAVDIAQHCFQVQVNQSHAGKGPAYQPVTHNSKAMTPLKILLKFFGKLDSYKGHRNTLGFKLELDELTLADKDELVNLAARELGVDVKND